MTQLNQAWSAISKLKYWISGITSWVDSCSKFFTVFGTVFPNNPMTILPVGLPPIETSKNTFFVTKVSWSLAWTEKHMQAIAPRYRIHDILVNWTQMQHQLRKVTARGPMTLRQLKASFCHVKFHTAHLRLLTGDQANSKRCFNYLLLFLYVLKYGNLILIKKGFSVKCKWKEVKQIAWRSHKTLAKHHSVCFCSCGSMSFRAQTIMKIAVIVSLGVLALVFLLLPDNLEAGKTKKGPLVTEKVCAGYY